MSKLLTLLLWVLRVGFSLGASHILDYAYHIQGMQSGSNFQPSKLKIVFKLRSVGVVRCSWDVGTIWSMQSILSSYIFTRR
jgi:hypothetical protein